MLEDFLWYLWYQDSKISYVKRVHIIPSVARRMELFGETTMRAELISQLSLVLLVATATSGVIADNPSRAAPRPYRVLVVISDQWDDPR